MSTITAPYTDARLDAVRQLAATKSDGLPFLLLPVRIETRFMKVEKTREEPAAEDSQFEAIAQLLIESRVLLSQDVDKVPPSDVKALLGEVNRKVTEALRLVDQNNSLFTATQRRLLKEGAEDIRPLLNQKAFSDFAALAKAIRTGLDKMSALLDAEKGPKDTTYQAARDYLRDMQDLELRLLRLRQGKIPYTRPIHKKDLYLFTDKLLRDSRDLYEQAARKTAAISLLEPAQYTAIAQAHAQIKASLPSLNPILGKVHDDKNWSAFLRTIDTGIRQMAPALTAFETDILPRLEFLSQIDRIRADELFFQHLRLLGWVESLAGDPQPERLRTAAPKLKKAIKQAARQNRKLITGTARQYDRLYSAWRELDTSLGSLQQRREEKSRGRSSRNENPFFRKKITLLPPPTPAVLSAKMSRGESNRLEALQAFDQEALTHSRHLLQATRSREFDGKAVAGQLEQFRKTLAAAKSRQLFLTQSRQQGLEKELELLQKQVASAKLTRKEKTPLSNQVSELRQEMSVAGARSLKTTADQYRFTTELEDAVVLPMQELVDELWVRIFPDDLFVHTHEEGLTPQEKKAAHDYWRAVWGANQDQGPVLSVWRMLCARFGKNRAAWIVTRTDPARVGARKNTQAFNNKPVNYLYQALPDLEWLQANLNVPEGKAPETPHPYENGEVLDRFTLINKNLALAADHLQYDTLAGQCRTISRTIFSRLYTLDKEWATDKPKPTAGSTDLREQILSAFTLQEQLLAGLKVVSVTEYVRSLAVPFVFPEVPDRPSSWSVAPHTRLLPRQFAVLTMNGDSFEHIAVGNPIPDRLALGMDPASEEEGAYELDEHGNLLVEEGIRWMTDFEAAIQAGMALKIPLSPEAAERGFDRVLALGLKETGVERSQALLEEWLQNHHYAADGLELLKIGTPTNNTEGEGSGYGSLEEEWDEAHELELGAPRFDPHIADPLERTDGRRLADALGVNADALQHIRNADGREVSQALWVNRCLSYATLRDYMEEMMDSLFTQDNIQRTHAFFDDAVVARGALPSFRIGPQPYGLLVASAWSRYRFHKDYNDAQLPPPGSEANRRLRFDIRLHRVLDILRGQWNAMRQALVQHAEGLAGKADPQQAFLEMLGLQANSAEAYFRYGVNIAYRGSAAVNAEFIGDYREEDPFAPLQLYYLFQSLIDSGDYGDEIPADTVNHFDKSRLFRCRFLEDTATLSGGLVDDAFPAAETLPLPADAGPEYINWLLDQTNLYAILADNNAADFPSRSLLFLLLRQAFLIAYREVALDILQQEGLIDAAFRRLIGSSDHYISPDQKFRTKWSYLMLDFTIGSSGNFDPYFDFSFIDLDAGRGINDLINHPFVKYLSDRDLSIAQYLFGGYLPSRFPDHQAHFDKVTRIREDFARLAALSSREWDQLLREHLDTCSYRLDAWMMGLYNQRLWELRSETPKGVLLGAYAWVENLRPGGARTEKRNVPAPLKEEGDIIYTDADNQGFIHAPSLNQAVAAAVLRSGYQANASEGDLHNQFAVNLSSFRVRKALEILSGVAAGQELSAILGYQFEKGLHERYREVELDRFITPFRKEFPLTTPVAEDISINDTADSLASNVVDALSLLEKVEEEIAPLALAAHTSLYELLTINAFAHCPAWLSDLVRGNGGGDAELTAVIREIDRMADAFDAIGDLVTSESVYQIVQGNHVRAAAIVQALADGKAIPEPQVAFTPRTGTLVNHRVALCLDPGATDTATGWPVATWRSTAAPALNHWLGSVLGGGSGVRLRVQIDQTWHTYALDTFALQPIDLLYLIHPDPANPNAALADLVRFHLRVEEQIPDEAPLILDFRGREVSWPGDVKTIYELQPLVAQLKELIADARPLSAEDLRLPDGEPDEEATKGQDLGELVARIEPAKDELLQLRSDIALFLTAHPEAITAGVDFATARGYLWRAFYLGIPNPVSGIGGGDTPVDSQALLQRLSVVEKALAKKQASIETVLAGLGEELDTDTQVRQWTAVGKAVFGGAFPVIPRFAVVDAYDLAGQLSTDPARRLQIGQGEPLLLDTWLQGMSRVRPKMAALEMQRLLLEAEGRATPPFEPVQLPFQSGDYWLGVDYPAGRQPAGDTLSLVLLDSPHLLGGAVEGAGILLDEWTELIPRREEVSGISFHYDQPDATPPQSLLLAVSPRLSGKWNWDDLVYTLIDTLELAKNRAVEPDHIEQSIFGQILPAVVSEVVPPQVAEDGYENPLGTQVVMDFMDNIPPVEEGNV